MKSGIDTKTNLDVGPVLSSDEIRKAKEAEQIKALEQKIEALEAQRDETIKAFKVDSAIRVRNFEKKVTENVEDPADKKLTDKVDAFKAGEAKKLQKLEAKYDKKIKSLQAKIDYIQKPLCTYDEESQTVVRLVTKKERKSEYQVIGIEETISKNNWKAWIYLGPIIVLVGVFLLYPLINTIFIAFTNNYSQITGEFDGLTLNNFGVILGLTSYNGAYEVNFTRYAIPNTFFLLLTVPISTLLALLIAVALNSIKWFKKALQTIFFLPYVTNTIAVGMVFSVIFDNSGLINFLFKLDTKWIYGADRWTAMVPLMIYIVWNALPFKILILLSGLQGIDKQYYQAAQIDSASRGKVLTKITIPLLSPQILYILVTSFMGAFKEYTAVVGLFNGPGTLGVGSEPNMETVVYYVYEKMSTQTSFAAAAAVFLFVIILCFTALQFWAGKKRVYY